MELKFLGVTGLKAEDLKQDWNGGGGEKHQLRNLNHTVSTKSIRDHRLIIVFPASINLGGIKGGA